MTLLTIITRTYKRPQMLARCMASLEAQSDGDYQHILLVDEEGIGIAETYRRMRQRNWADIRGDYVYLLDDDCTLAGVEAIATLRRAIIAARPKLIFVKAEICEWGILPGLWRLPPVRGRIDLGCVIMQRGLFRRAARRFGAAYDGDYDFIMAGYGMSRQSQTIWLDHLFMRAQQIGRGKPE